MSKLLAVVPIEQQILFLRGQRVLLDTDLARLYSVSTKRLNEQVKRNRTRFPGDFMFRISRREFNELVAICDRFQGLKHSSSRPFAFTEHGAIMAASVLNTPRAVQTSLLVVRAFVRLREFLSAHKDLARKLEALEQKCDGRFKEVFAAIRQLMTRPSLPPVRIQGFRRS